MTLKIEWINMKKVLIFVIMLVITLGCCESNQGYGYNTRTSVPDVSQPSSESASKSLFNQAYERRMTHTMELKGTDGKILSSCTVYKGEFDGHTWYVFYDRLASPSVVHDPNCKCMKHD